MAWACGEARARICCRQLGSSVAAAGQGALCGPGMSARGEFRAAEVGSSGDDGGLGAADGGGDVFAPYRFHWDFVSGMRWPGGAIADDAHAAPAGRVAAADGVEPSLAGGASLRDRGVAAAGGATRDEGRATGEPCAAGRPGLRPKGSVAQGGLARGFLVRSAGRRKAGEAAAEGASASSGSRASARAAPAPVTYDFGPKREVSVGGARLWQQSGAVEKLGRREPCRFYRLPGFVPGEEAARILELCRRSGRYRTDADSVDKAASFEYYPLQDGRWTDESMQRLLGGIVDRSILPYVRERYACPSCTVSDILVRRYAPGERRTHAVHFDGHAFVTAVLGLSPPDGIEGGLYLQPEPHISSRVFFRMEPGDLVVHSFDLQHGVHVWKGVRYSLVLWVKDSPESVRDRTTPWYDELAEAGDPDALYNLAQNFEHGLFGRPLDLARAAELYEKSAGQGHHFAQNNLALLYRKLNEEAAAHGGGGDPGLLDKSAALLLAAAAAGFALAQKNLAVAFANGHGVQQDDAQAICWMRQSAEQHEVEAAFMLGEFCRQGRGGPRDLVEAMRWYERSAEAGFPRAQFTLGMMLLEGTGVEKDLGRAEYWLRCAAGQGDSEAKNNVATIYAQRGEVESAANIWCELATKGEPNAQCNLGMCYVRGLGRQRDLEAARRWLQMAAAQGHAMSAQALSDLAP